MRAALVILVLAAGLGGCANETVHTLTPPTFTMPETKACTIGVGRFADAAGFDYASDLRDYLKDHGPCRTVMLVADPHDERADVVVSGTVSYMDGDKSTLLASATPERMAGAWCIALGALPTIVGVSMLSVGAANVSQYPDTNKNLVIGGGALMGAGLVSVAAGLLVIHDSKEHIELDAKVSADVDISGKDGKGDHFHLDDTVAVREPPATKDEPTWGYLNIYASLQPALLGRVFEHVASHLAALPLQAGGAASGT